MHERYISRSSQRSRAILLDLFRCRSISVAAAATVVQRVDRPPPSSSIVGHLSLACICRILAGIRFACCRRRRRDCSDRASGGMLLFADVHCRSVNPVAKQRRTECGGRRGLSVTFAVLAPQSNIVRPTRRFDIASLFAFQTSSPQSFVVSSAGLQLRRRRPGLSPEQQSPRRRRQRLVPFLSRCSSTLPLIRSLLSSSTSSSSSLVVRTRSSSSVMVSSSSLSWRPRHWTSS